jgi:dipeptidase E
MGERHLVARGGGVFAMEPSNPVIDYFGLGLARRKKRPRVCFIATASGDNDNYIGRFHRAFPPSRAEAIHLPLFDRTVRDLNSLVLEQDVIYVGGGNTANLLSIWRLHKLDRSLRAAWRAGVVMAGISAGAICWFQHGITDSFGQPVRALGDGLGFIAGGCCPHFDGETERRPVLHRLIRRVFPTTLALDDGAAANFVGTRLREVVSSRPNARAMRVSLVKSAVVETRMPVRYLGRQRRR